MPFVLTIFALVLVVVTLVTVVGVLGFVVANIAIVALALLGGLAISALLGGVSPGTTIIATLALMLLMLSAKQRQLQRRNRGYDVDLVAEPRATKTKRGKSLPPDPACAPLDLAWTAVGEHADWARSRLAVAQESCRLFLRLADRQPLDMEAGGLAVRIRKRIPEHVAECLDKCELATPSERRAILEELVFTLEKVGASADRERARLMGPATDEINIQRRHLTRETDDGPLGPA